MSKYRNYLYDLSFLIKERALNAKKAREQEKKGSEGICTSQGVLWRSMR